MAIRPFPFPFRVGTDICRIDRILRIICKPNTLEINRVKLNHFLHRVLNRKEISQLQSSLFVANAPKLAEHLAGRWAAKEAIIKASSRKVFMKDIIIYRERSSTDGPRAVILDQSLTEVDNFSEDVSNELYLDGQSVLLTISHENDYAIATAVVPD